MSMRLRRGGVGVATPPPPASLFGPDPNAGYVRSNAGPQRNGVGVTIGTPSGVEGTTWWRVNPANSQATNQQVINAHPAGTIYWPPGTYTCTAAFTLLAGQTHQLATGPLRTASDTAILTASTSLSPAVINLTGSKDYVTWRGGIIHGGARCFRTAGTWNPTTSTYNDDAPEYLTVEDAEFRYAGATCFGYTGGEWGYDPVRGMVVRHCWFHHGGTYNVNGVHSIDSIWEYNRSEYGNTSHQPLDRVTNYPSDEGASKFLGMVGMIWRYNWSRYNDGSEWWDTNNEGILIEDSVFDSNYQAGVFIEDNGGVIIRRCTFNDNGKVDPVGGAWEAGDYHANLFISASEDVEITKCDVIRTNTETQFNHEGDLRLVDSGARLHDLRNLWVHHNRFTRTRPAATGRGFVSNRNALPFLLETTYNNKWDYNEYHVLPIDYPNGNFAFWPSGTNKTFTQWQAGGVDPYAPGSFYDPNSTLAGDA